METLVPGWMPRAGLLLLPLLLCFGPETAGSINPEKLNVIVNYVKTYGGVNNQYAFAVSLTQDVCGNPQEKLENSLPRTELQQMREMIEPFSGLYNPPSGNIVAARPKEVTPGGKVIEHSEWRLLYGPDNPVSRLKSRTHAEKSCLILFTYNSPCSQQCLLEDGPYNIVNITSKAFRDINNNYKAFVFQDIYNNDREWTVTRQALLHAWHQLRNVTLLRCDNNGCHDCAGNDTVKHPNPCLAGKKWKKEQGQRMA